MEKQTIVIRKIKENHFIEKNDEVAIEQDFTIELQNGEKIYGSCTPTHMEEMILGSRYLANDLTEKECEKYGLKVKSHSILETVNVQELFQVANECFENPGSLFAYTG